MAQAADVVGVRERRRKRRLLKLAAILAGPIGFLWYRIADGRPFNPFAFPHISGEAVYFLPMMVIFVFIAALMVIPFMAQGRSPHIMYRPEQIDVTLDDVKGLEAVREEVIRTLNVFLGYATFRRELGGNPRRGVLFEGPPGTGKTHLAKAMAKQAGVPFLFISSPSFTSMWQGQSARRVRAFFKKLRKLARKEGGAIGFIEEIDAVAGVRGGMNASPTPIGDGLSRTVSMFGGGGGDTSAMVNQLLIELQSFDEPPPRDRIKAKLSSWINAYLPAERQLKAVRPPYNN